MHLRALLLSAATLLLLPSAAAAACHQDDQAAKGYKCGYLGGEIPETWSAVYNGPDIVPMNNARIVRWGGTEKSVDFLHGKPFYSVAQDIVMYGDMHWNQLDFFFTSGANVQRTVKLLKKNPGNIVRWSTATVGGKQAIVAEEGLDEGEVTKAGPGGKYYFVSWPLAREGQAYEAGLIIHKQALGDAAFEQGTSHVLSSLGSLTWLETPHESFKR